ncbi:MAG: sortase [Bacilli bacterium]|nr:sortase [Bacilli bacterium]MBR4002882.1 sortase [Clostridia bacterium]
MLKRKTKNNNGRKGQLLIVGSFLIIIGIGILGGKLVNSYLDKKQEQDLINNFYEQQEEYVVDVPVMEEELVEEEVVEQEEKKETTTPTINYIAVVKIPKIGLEKGLASKGSYWNNVNRNIEILSESDMPDVENGNVILAGHSGNSGVSYFRKLNKLQNDDTVSIVYNGKEYKYKMVNSYEIEKNGYAHIVRNAEKSTLTLITCKHNTNKQIVVICELVEVI